MTDEEADEFLRNNEWCKWSDARDMVQEAWLIGYKAAKAELKVEQSKGCVHLNKGGKFGCGKDGPCYFPACDK